MNEYYCVWINKRYTKEKTLLVVKVVDEIIVNIELFYVNIEINNIMDLNSILGKKLDIALSILNSYANSENLNSYVTFEKISEYSYNNISKIKIRDIINNI